MNKTKWLVVALSLLVLLNLALMTFLFFKPGPPPHLPNPQVREIIISQLNFNDQQAADYEKLIREHQQQIREKQEEIRQLKQDLYKQLISEDLQRKENIIEHLGSLQMEIEQVHYNHFESIKELCTPDQLPAFEQLSEDLARLFASGAPRPPQ
ncbi:MAG: periplasmic heavy metal sensor [Bacteroidetes bacterium]|nr:periplasmic heavy metal sensor [Bacteroidota bacterium]